MHKNKESNDVTVKMTKNALKQLEKKARPFESKKECLERIIMQNCGSKENKEFKEPDSDPIDSETPQEEEEPT